MKKLFLINFIYSAILLMLLSCNTSKEEKEIIKNSNDKNISAQLKSSDTCFKGIMMIEEQPVFCILDSTTPDKASFVMQRNYEKILKDAEYTEASVADQPGCIFYHSSPEKIVFETFMFLKSKPKRNPKYAKPVILEKTLALLYDHYGSFNRIHQSYDKIKEILKENRYKQIGPAREVYVVGEDTNRWRTRIIVPIIQEK
ncbi:MAG: GyrI-like domain-containing protein [Bacteroidota bacterium]